MNQPDHRLKERLRWAGIGIGLKVLALVLRRTARKDDWLGRALDQAVGVYRFEDGSGALFRHLIFQNGRVKAQRDWPQPADFTLTLYQPSALGIGTKPESVLEVVIGNKVGQSGNLYYIYQFGFILSLLERYFTARRLKRKAATAKT